MSSAGEGSPPPPPPPPPPDWPPPVSAPASVAVAVTYKVVKLNEEFWFAKMNAVMLNDPAELNVLRLEYGNLLEFAMNVPALYNSTNPVPVVKLTVMFTLAPVVIDRLAALLSNRIVILLAALLIVNVSRIVQLTADAESVAHHLLVIVPAGNIAE